MSQSSSTDPASSTTTARIVVVLVELRCLLCADTIGTLEMHRWPSFGPARLRTTPEAPALAIVDWSRLRCVRCGGNVYPDEISTTRVYPPVAWDSERPRRGRPPKWLAEQRRVPHDPESN